MTATQIVEIPADHRLTIDVPREIPIGKAALTFTLVPAPKGSDPRTAEDSLGFEGECPLCAKSHTPNAINKLRDVMGIIINEQPLPPERRNHQLHGEWEGAIRNEQ